MVRADYAYDHMTEQEIVASNTQLVFAGNETTAKLLAQLLVTLAAHPEQRRAIQADRALIPAAVEETHRFEAITHSVFRAAIGDDATIGDVTIPADQRITLLLGAANRDPPVGTAPTSSTCSVRSCPTSVLRSVRTAASA
jgi:cytochrome P450